MKKYKQGRFLKIKNINGIGENSFKIRYTLFGIKFTIKNKKKIKFYTEQKIKISASKNFELVKELETYRKYAEKQNPIVTCCIITYNHVDSISKTIDSILEQETKYPFIIKIYDDASVDGTTDICMEYARKYPEKVQYYLQPINTKARHASSFYLNLKTKYYTVIDGDDYWCDNTRLEQGIDFLEANPEYVIWAHDTLFIDKKTNRSTSYIHHQLKRKKIKNPVSFDNYVFLHPASRIHRNVIDYNKEYVYNRKRDIFTYYASLDRGPAYYVDRIMSACVQTGVGVFSKLNEFESIYSTKYSYYAMNKYLNYRRDKYFTLLAGSSFLKFAKLLFGKRLGWNLYIFRYKIKQLVLAIKKQWKSFKNVEKGHNLFDKYDYEELLRISKYQ